MPSYPKPLNQSPFHKWGINISGAASLDPKVLCAELARDVKSIMENQNGITVIADATDVTVGGLLNRTTFPGVRFTFKGHTDWAGFLVGMNKKAAILTVDVVQVGSVSRAMQRINDAERKGALSLTGALQRAVTNQDAVETEGLYYTALLQSIETVVGSWTE